MTGPDAPEDLIVQPFDSISAKLTREPKELDSAS